MRSFTRPLGMRILALIAFTAAALALEVTAQPLTARAVDQSTVSVTVTITSFTELEDPDPAVLQGNGDYYAVVDINDTQLSGIDDVIIGPEPDEADYTITPDWTFTHDIDPCENGGNFDVVVWIWDQDPLFLAPDDQIDVSPSDNFVAETKRFNVFHLGGETVVQEGNGEAGELGPTAGGEKGRVEFTVTGGFSDTDGDGLPDPWETDGADVDCDGDVDVDLPAMGADPDHKDLFVEMDWQSANLPSAAFVEQIKQSFANAPVDAGGTANPDGQPGINLRVDTGSLTEGGNLVGDDLGGGNAVSSAVEFCDLGSDKDENGSPDYYESKSTNFSSARSRIFRYAVSVRNIGGCAGGWGEVGGNDMIIINSGNAWGATFMHELGHTLALGHGGNDGNSCKPNYVSVMSYNYPGGIMWTDFGQTGGGELHLDYSPPMFNDVTDIPRRSSPLPDLDEANLNESPALTGNPILEFRYTNARGQRVSQPLDRRPDWDGNGDRSGSGLSVNIDDNGTSGPSACDNATADSELRWNDDWRTMSLPFQHFGASDSTGETHDHRDPTNLEIMLLEIAVNITDLSADVSGPATAIAGETATYTVDVTNNGPNDADDAIVTSTLPAGTTFDSGSAGCSETSGAVTCELGAIETGSAGTASITLAIDPAYVADAGTSPAPLSVSASAENRAAPDSDATNNSGSADTDVTAEVDVSVSKTADAATVAAGTSTTYTIDVSNGGPSTATGVSFTDTLPSGMTYATSTGVCAHAAGVVSCDIGTLQPGADASIDITADVAADLVHNAGGPVTLTNNVTATSDGAESEESDNSDALDTEIIARADLEVVSVSAVSPPARLILGSPGSITVRTIVTNNGPSAPIDATLDLGIAAPAGATASPSSDEVAVAALGLDEERTIDRTFTVACSTPGSKTYAIDASIAPASADDDDPDSSNDTGSVNVTVECVVPVKIVVNPGGDPASVINLRKGVIPVAVLTSAAGEYGLPVAFDATTIAPASVRFGPRALVLAGGGASAQKGAGTIEDARAPSRDGDLDMVMQFRADQTGLVTGDAEGCAFGTWSDGGTTYWFLGCGPIRTSR